MAVNLGLDEEFIDALLKRYVDEGGVRRLKVGWCLSKMGSCCFWFPSLCEHPSHETCISTMRVCVTFMCAFCTCVRWAMRMV